MKFSEVLFLLAVVIIFGWQGLVGLIVGVATILGFIFAYVYCYYHLVDFLKKKFLP